MHLSVEFRTNKEIMGCRCPSLAVNSRKMQPLRRAGPAITRALGSRTPISVSKDSFYLYLKFGKIREFGLHGNRPSCSHMFRSCVSQQTRLYASVAVPLNEPLEDVQPGSGAARAPQSVQVGSVPCGHFVTNFVHSPCGGVPLPLG